MMMMMVVDGEDDNNGSCNLLDYDDDARVKKSNGLGDSGWHVAHGGW